MAKRPAPRTAFKPGKSGNPGGRPKGLGDLRDLARQHTKAALQTLVTVMKSPKATDSARVAAADAVLSRGWGRPSQHLEVEGKLGFADLLAALNRDADAPESAGDAREVEGERPDLRH